MFKISLFIKLLFHPKRELFVSLKNVLDFYPNDLKYYEKAFIHKSASVTDENGRIINNERLEFLGDAVLDSVIADYLFKHFPEEKEGFLTKMRSKIVNREFLKELAQKIGITQFVVSNTQFIQRTDIYGDTFEAIIGAIYLDKGYRFTGNYIKKLIQQNYINLDELQEIETNFKSKLIEWGQKHKKMISFYTQELNDIRDKSATFISQVKIEDEVYGEGKGKSKKEAEQNASEKGFLKLKRGKEL